MRIVEAYVGEYASGKSEVAINRALELKSQGREVTLIDLDMVEPCYTLRPLKVELEALGIKVISWETKDTFGLGEAGQTIVPAARWCLRQKGDVIIDVGYGVYGISSLNLVENILDCEELVVTMVLNAKRPMTGNTMLIAEYLEELGRVDAVFSNSHLGIETTPEVVEYGITEAKKLNLPITGVGVSDDFSELYPDFSAGDLEIKILKRYMPNGFW